MDSINSTLALELDLVLRQVSGLQYIGEMIGIMYSNYSRHSFLSGWAMTFNNV